MKRHISLILALITAGTLVSCGDDTGPVQTDRALADALTDTPETDIYSSLPTGNYGGAEFKILNNISNFAYTLMDLESETGDVLDDAVYQRTRSVEDRLGVKISVTDLGWDEALDMIKSQIMSGDDGYDICFDEVSTLALAYEPGMFTDIGTISTVDLTKPWWNRMANDSIRVGDATYYLFGDIHLMLWECYMPVVANLTLAESLGIDDLYDTVESGKWTLDTMYSCMRSAALDLNGDTKTDAEDRFGLSMYPWNAMSFFTGCGVSLIEKESDGIPVYTGVTERFSAVYEKLALGFLSDKDLRFDHNTKGFNKLEGDGVTTKFLNGGALFFAEPIGSVKRLRNADFALGILPLPKYNEEQENYISYILNSPAALVVPSTNVDTEMTGVVIENLSAESYRTVRPVYFDKTLDFKYATDERSINMLDTIFENGNFDLTVVFGWGKVSSKVIDLVTTGSEAYVSGITAVDKAVREDIEKTVEKYS